MSRYGCNCDRVRKGDPYTPDQCPQCWGFWHVDLINRALGGTGVVSQLFKIIPSHLPEPEIRSFAPVQRRHLVYHLCPVRDRWQYGIEQIWQRRHLFNGTMVFSIAVGARARGQLLDSPDVVRRHLPPNSVALETPHNPRTGEVASWIPLWNRVLQDAAPDDAILYAHSKGVTRPHTGAYRQWSETLYSLALDHWAETAKLLEQYPIVGSFKKHSQEGFPGSHSTWHYSGTFYWVRVSDFVQRPWKSIGQRWAATESWVGESYHPNDGGVLFAEGDTRMDLYDANHWALSINSAYHAWLTEHPADVQRVPVRLDPLYILTPMTRPQNMSRIAETLRNMRVFDVRWVVVPAGDLPSYGGPERMRALDGIPANAWVWCLDDDTTVHPGLSNSLQYAIARNSEADVFVFGQANADGSKRLDPVAVPEVGKIDTGQVVFRRRIADGLQWGPEYAADFEFFKRLFSGTSSERIVCVPECVTLYNSLS